MSFWVSICCSEVWSTGGWPVSISNTTQASEYTSLRTSIVLARRLLGAHVRRTAKEDPETVIRPTVDFRIAVAMPKSATTA